MSGWSRKRHWPHAIRSEGQWSRKRLEPHAVVVAKMYRKLMGMALERKAGAATAEVNAMKEKRHQAKVKKSMKRAAKVELDTAKNASAQVGSEKDVNDTILPEMKIAEMLCHRVRYFTAGAVIGSKAFVNQAFTKARERFREKRKDGARRMKGNAASAKGLLWSMRDLKVESVISR